MTKETENLYILNKSDDLARTADQTAEPRGKNLAGAGFSENQAGSKAREFFLEFLKELVQFVIEKAL